MFAIACTLSGMPPSEYAPCTAIGTLISDTSMRLTVSTSGITHAAPAEHDAIADGAAVRRVCLRPEKIRISFGRQIRSR